LEHFDNLVPKGESTALICKLVNVSTGFIDIINLVIYYVKIIALRTELDICPNIYFLQPTLRPFWQAI
jgi:hypothetical protein